uniref:Uncharacterized protein n=1 Tax=Oryza meridionalis TaxID=40149 RepID=A0A0E0D4G3_9ORYZ
MQGLASPRCAPFCGRSGATGAGAAGAPRTRRQQGGGCGARPLDRVAGWVGGGIAAAFFASLERCSCVNVRTHDELDDETTDSEVPLIMFDVVDGSGDAAAAGGTGAAGGRRSRRSEKSKQGGGGCGGQLW